MQLLKALGWRGAINVLFVCTGGTEWAALLPFAHAVPAKVSLTHAWAKSQKGWGCPPPWNHKILFYELWNAHLFIIHISEMRSHAKGISGSTGTPTALGSCQQGCRETFPAIASAPQMGATTGFSKLFFNRPTKNLMQGNSGTILFILGVILNVLKVGKALNRT